MTTLAGVRYEPTQLVIPAELTLDEYVSLLLSLGGIARGHQWWVGDALVEGERRYGDEFAQHADSLGLEPHTLTNWRWVADAVAPSRRRDDLTWSHHAEVARLAPADQARALASAAKQGWNVRQLRDYVAITWPAREQLEFEQDGHRLGDREEIDVNRRLEEIERRWADADTTDAFGHRRRLTTDDVADVRWLVSIAKRLVRS